LQDASSSEQVCTDCVMLAAWTLGYHLLAKSPCHSNHFM
jgi:hypothetical protein